MLKPGGVISRDYFQNIIESFRRGHDLQIQVGTSIQVSGYVSDNQRYYINTIVPVLPNTFSEECIVTYFANKNTIFGRYSEAKTVRGYYSEEPIEILQPLPALDTELPILHLKIRPSSSSIESYVVNPVYHFRKIPNIDDLSSNYGINSNDGFIKAKNNIIECFDCFRFTDFYQKLVISSNVINQTSYGSLLIAFASDTGSSSYKSTVMAGLDFVAYNFHGNYLDKRESRSDVSHFSPVRIKTGNIAENTFYVTEPPQDVIYAHNLVSADTLYPGIHSAFEVRTCASWGAKGRALYLHNMFYNNSLSYGNLEENLFAANEFPYFVTTEHNYMKNALWLTTCPYNRVITAFRKNVIDGSLTLERNACLTYIGNNFFDGKLDSFGVPVLFYLQDIVVKAGSIVTVFDSTFPNVCILSFQGWISNQTAKLEVRSLVDTSSTIWYFEGPSTLTLSTIDFFPYSTLSTTIRISLCVENWEEEAKTLSGFFSFILFGGGNNVSYS